MGFSEDPALQPLIFELFLSMHLITVSGNFLIILAILSDTHLHTPMYFFLTNLSMVDVCFTSTTIPKMLVNIQAQSRAISYADCITQMFLFILFAGLDDFLLTLMAYDRLVAICHPLHYIAIMTPRLCVQLVLVCWVLAALDSLVHSLLVLRLSFCAHMEIPHFFCETNQVVHRACSDTFLNDLIMYLAAVFFIVGPLTGILYSYFKIISSICATSLTQEKNKAISTCASHLSAISLFYGTGLSVYLSAGAATNSASTAATSVMYTMVTPMLRNTDMKKALKRLLFHK